MNTLPYIKHGIKRIAKAVLPGKIYRKLSGLRGLFHKNSIARSNKAEIACHYSTELPRGVNLFIHCIKSSAGVEGRLLQRALESVGIPYRIFDLSDPEKRKPLLKDEKLYNVNLVVCHAASSLAETLLLFGLDWKKHYTIGYCAWELPGLPDAFCPSFRMFQEMWTLSGFCTGAVEKKSSVPVLTVPLYADKDRTVIPNGRDHFKIDKDVFLFMFSYDCNSYVSRKNPQALVQAFLKAFSPEDRHVGLALKLNYPENFKAHIEELLEILAPYPHVYYINQYLTDEEMRTLIYISDAVVSLHRSEGFGLLPIEAMALGTPVIATAWSGNMEYMNHMNTALVGYTMTPVNGRYVGSTPGDGLFWAEPDIDEAASHMRRIVSDRAWREKLIANGKRTVDESFNAAAIGKIMRDRLELLKLI